MHAGNPTDTLQVRNVLGTPVPRVFAWSSTAQENPVGAEYIIMEKVPGIEQERVWPSMKIADRFTLVKAIAGFQKAWTSVSFKKFGGLYYAKDLEKKAENEPLYTDANGVDVTDAKFAIGPSTGRELIDYRRATIDFDRGPCKISNLGLCLTCLMNTREDFRGVSHCNWASRNSLRQSAPSPT
jgi:hypothetical protein